MGHVVSRRWIAAWAVALGLLAPACLMLTLLAAGLG